MVQVDEAKALLTDWERNIEQLEHDSFRRNHILSW